jgi:hypothetical protein
MKWRIEEGNEGYKIVSYSDSSMVLATNSSSATVGQKLILGDYVDNDSYRDEWDFYDIVFSYVNYYDSTFTGSNSYLQAYISNANEFSDIVYRRYFGVGFRMDGAAQQNNGIIADSECSQGVNLPCTDACGSPHHKDGLVISNALYNAPRENNHVYIMWTHRPAYTYCYIDNDDVHSEVSWIAVVYGKRPVIHFMRISGDDHLQQQACMTLNLVHETAHTFGMDDVYDNAGHDISGAYHCVMERFEREYASEYYTDVLLNRNDATAFCNSCLATLQSLVPKKLHHHN